MVSLMIPTVEGRVDSKGSRKNNFTFLCASPMVPGAENLPACCASSHARCGL